MGFEEEFTKRMFKVVKLFDRTLDRLVILPIFPVSYPRLQLPWLPWPSSIDLQRPGGGRSAK